MNPQEKIENKSFPYQILLLVALGIKAVAMILFILKGGIGLGPDEAQYWTWSRALDLGYYSKPPGIAWQIWLGTSLAGQTELGVRLGAVLIGFVLPFLVYRLARMGGLSDAAAFWCAIAFAFSPMGVMSSFLAITDGGMMLFWTAVCGYLCQKIAREETPNYFIVGLGIGLGALFKWPTYFLWIAILIGCFWIRSLRSWQIPGGMLLSLLALLPSLYWNYRHDWATFKHVGATLAGGSQLAAKTGYQGNSFEFIGAQAALVSPILFILLIAALIWLFIYRKNIPSVLLFCGLVSGVSLVFGLAASTFMKVQGNWVIFAYSTAFVVLGWFCYDLNKKVSPYYFAGIALSLVLTGFVLSIPQLQSRGVLSIPYKISPFKHNVGWDHLTEVLKRTGYRPEKDYLVSDKYQTVSELSFYGPEQKRAHFLNLHGVRRNQFSYWPGIESEGQEARGYFVVVENIPKLNEMLTVQAADYEKLLSNYYEKVEVIGLFPLFSANGSVAKGALVIEGIGFKGIKPEAVELY